MMEWRHSCPFKKGLILPWHQEKSYKPSYPNHSVIAWLWDAVGARCSMSKNAWICWHMGGLRSEFLLLGCILDLMVPGNGLQSPLRLSRGQISWHCSIKCLQICIIWGIESGSTVREGCTPGFEDNTSSISGGCLFHSVWWGRSSSSWSRSRGIIDAGK